MKKRGVRKARVTTTSGARESTADKSDAWCADDESERPILLQLDSCEHQPESPLTVAAAPTRLLSFDIGKRNLAYALIVMSPSGTEIRIEDWQVVDLYTVQTKVPEVEYLSALLSKSQYSKPELQNMVQNWEDWLQANAEEVKIAAAATDTGSKSSPAVLPVGTKAQLMARLDRALAAVKKRLLIRANVSLTEMDMLSVKLQAFLGSQPAFRDVTLVAIENQPAKKSQKMKNVQMVLYSWFNFCAFSEQPFADSPRSRAFRVQFVSARNKTTLLDSAPAATNALYNSFIAATRNASGGDVDDHTASNAKQRGGGKETKSVSAQRASARRAVDLQKYKERKAMAVCHAKFFLKYMLCPAEDRRWEDALSCKTKKDDLADSLLQGLFVLSRDFRCNLHACYANSLTSQQSHNSSQNL